MSDDRLIETPAPADLPTFKILSGGKEINREYQIKAISVVRSVNKITSASILIYDGDPAKEDFEISNSEAFLPGTEIIINAGYHSNEEQIFKGIVISQNIKVYEHKSAVLRIECRDQAIKMSIGRKNKYFYESSDSDVWEEILDSAGIQHSVSTTTLVHKQMVQFNVTDWDFLVSRAEVSGMCVYTDDGSIKITPPDLSAEPTARLLYGGNMLNFEAKLDARHQFNGINAYSWDPSKQELMEIEAAELTGSLPGNINATDLAKVIDLDHNDLHHPGQVKDAELQYWADALMLKSRLAKIQARAKIQGLSTIRPGQIVELGGVGDRFNGNAFVSAVRHEINLENWETNVEFGLSPKWFSESNDDINSALASGVIPALNGLQIGVVTALEGDPEGEGRIKVSIPTINATDEGIWARVATLDAGEGRGSFFMPYVKDEVILGFLNDDPRNPVVLGMVNSSNKPAAYEPNDENHERGLVTKSGMKVHFNDEKITLTISTPNGNTIHLDDEEGLINLEDEHGNRLTMNSEGITIESSKDLNLKASGDINLEGTNITHSANANFKAEGTGGAEMSSSATAVLKGSMVQIN